VRRLRKDHELPSVISREGWQFHHVGIPTKDPKPNEYYIEHLKVHVSGFETSPYGAEWMRFEEDSLISEIIRNIPHIAFEVDNLEQALDGRELLSEISSPSPGVRVAMIIDNGVPIELLQFEQSNKKRN
jgi:hypothetical protein